MKTSNVVTVFNFSEFELGSDVPTVAPYKASRETIVKHLHREVLEGTGEVVRAEDLDALGRYRRVATGWGELPPA